MEYIRFKDVIINSQYGYTAAETSLTEGTYKYLRITDIVPYYVDFESVPFCKITEKDVSKYIVNEGDILIARTGATTGYNYVVPSGINNTVYASYLIRFVVDKKLVHPLFLKYVFKTQSYYGFVNNYIGGAAQPGMNAKVFTKFNIPKFSLITQQKISSILSAYDRLIENNTRRIRLLEQMAENLYKEWFVRFRFPGHENVEMVNGLAKGWKVEKLGGYANISTGKCNREDAEEDGIYPLFDRSQEIKKSSKWIKDCEAIIVPGEGTSFIPRYYKGKFNLHQRCYCIEPIIKDTGFYLFYSIMLNRKYFLSVATGATVPSLRQNNFTKMKLIIAELELVKKYNKVADTIALQIDKLKEQNQFLIRQRDLLLPRLMSGKLEVKS